MSEHSLKIRDCEMPALGIGTWQLKGSDCRRSVLDALEIGYRHIDTARAYGNESDVGRAIQESGIPRNQIFVTTKLQQDDLGRKGTFRQIERSLSELDSEWVDLLLIHWPNPRFSLQETLEAMHELKDQGKARFLGVSNFSPKEMLEADELVPIMNNQVVFHPYHPQDEMVKAAKERNLCITAYSPLAKGEISSDETLSEIGKKYGKNAAQVALRWLLDFGNVAVIPRSKTRKHIQSNFELFDFALDEKDREQISDLAHVSAK